MSYLTLDGLAGKILPAEMYPDAMNAAAAAAKKIRIAQDALEAEKDRLNILNWGSVTGQEVFVSGGVDGGPLISRDGQNDIFMILNALSDLDNAEKAFAAQATRDNGIPPTQRGATDRSRDAHAVFSAMEDVRSRANETLSYWKWFEFQHSTPTNVADEFNAWVKSGIAPYIPNIPKPSDLDTIVLYGFVGLGLLLLLSRGR